MDGLGGVGDVDGSGWVDVLRGEVKGMDEEEEVRYMHSTRA
jgi:hypothetical protein